MASNTGNTPSNSSSGAPQPQQTRVGRTKYVVCTACRQSKVRCISAGQGDCERCSRLGLECRRDTNYIRQSKSRKIAELEKQVHRLTSAFNGVRSPPVNHQPPAINPNPTPALHPPQIDPRLGFNEVNPAPRPAFNNSLSSGNVNSWLSSQPPPAIPTPNLNSGFTPFTGCNKDNYSDYSGPRPPASSPRSLKSLHLTAAQIDNLFQIFYDHYHPLFPFMHPSKSPDRLYESGEAVFWALIGVASRRYQDDFMLFNLLSEWVPKLVWNAISSPPYRGPAVQAVILLSAWPFPFDSTWTDSSITMSSIAISIAMQAGLHRPMNPTDFRQTKANVNADVCRLRTATWAAANMVCETSTSALGLLPLAPFDKTIDYACQPGSVYTLPDDLRMKLILQRYCHRATQVIYGDLRESSDASTPGDHPGFMLIWESNLNALNSELDNIEEEYSHTFSAHDRIHVAIARLYVHSMYFFDSSHTETRKEGILKAYKSATKLALLVIEADKATDFLLYATAYDIRMFVVAACILLKVLRSSYSQDVDFEAGKTLLNQTTALTSRCVLGNNDSRGKIVKMVAQIWHSSNTEVLNEPPELLVKSRLGASIIFDFIWTWRQEFGGVPNAYPSSKSIASETPPEDLMPSIFQDASFVDLDFLNDPGWMDGFGASMF